MNETKKLKTEKKSAAKANAIAIPSSLHLETQDPWGKKQKGKDPRKPAISILENDKKEKSFSMTCI